MENKDIKTEENRKKEESYGGYKYKKNYDEYKKELEITEKDQRKNKAMTAVIITCFVVITLVLAFFIMETILKADGRSFFGVSTEKVPEQTAKKEDTAINEAEADSVMNGFTVYIETESRSGAGIIVTEDGYIVTNHELIKGAETVTVKLSDDSQYNAVISGTDDDTGICIVKINASALDHAVMSIDSEPAGGELLYYKIPQNDGVYKCRSVLLSDLSEFGIDKFCSCSGCPLIDEKGEVVGITTGRYGKNSAVHVSSILNALPELISEFTIPENQDIVSVDSLNVYLVTVTQKQSSVYGIPAGCLIFYAPSSSKLRKDDIIISANGVSVKSVEELLSVISDSTETELEVYKKSDKTTYNVIIEQ